MSSGGIADLGIVPQESGLPSFFHAFTGGNAEFVASITDTFIFASAPGERTIILFPAICRGNAGFFGHFGYGYFYLCLCHRRADYHPFPNIL